MKKVVLLIVITALLTISGITCLSANAESFNINSNQIINEYDLIISKNVEYDLIGSKENPLSEIKKNDGYSEKLVQSKKMKIFNFQAYKILMQSKII